MKKIIAMILSVFIFSCACAQNKITGVSTYISDDSITVSVTELNYLIAGSIQVCTKIDTLDDGYIIKTVEIKSRDTIFRLIGAYLESEPFFPNDSKISMEVTQKNLKCSVALVDNGGLYETYALNVIGRRYFERILNKTSLVCIDPYE